MDVRNACCIGNTTSYGKELYLSCYHFESMLFGFVDNRSTDLYMRNSSGLVIFDAGIYYNKYIQGRAFGISEDLGKKDQVCCYCFRVYSFYTIERETIRINIYNTSTRGEFLMETVKRGRYLVKAKVDICNRALKFEFLFVYELLSRQLVKRYIL